MRNRTNIASKTEKVFDYIDFKKKRLIDAEKLAKDRYYDDITNERLYNEYIKAQAECEKFFRYRVKTNIKLPVGECTFWRKIEGDKVKESKKLSKSIKKHLQKARV